MAETAKELLITGYLLDRYPDLSEEERDYLCGQLLDKTGSLPIDIADLDRISACILAGLHREAPPLPPPQPGDILELTRDNRHRFFVVVRAAADPAGDEASLEGLEVEVIQSEPPAAGRSLPEPRACRLRMRSGGSAAAARRRKGRARALQVSWTVSGRGESSGRKSGFSVRSNSCCSPRPTRSASSGMPPPRRRPCREPRVTDFRRAGVRGDPVRPGRCCPH